MLIEITLGFLVSYGVTRAIEYQEKRARASTKSDPNSDQQTHQNDEKNTVEVIQAAPETQIPEILTTDQSLKISGVSLGAMLIGGQHPLVALGSIAGVTYTSLTLFHRAAHGLFKEGKIRHDLVISVSFATLLLTGYYPIIPFGNFLYFIGKKIQEKASGYSEQQITDMFERFPRTVWVLNEAVELEIPLEQLRVHDVVVVHAGEIIPVDGTIVSGRALVDQQALTGEFQPAEKAEGDSVLASTMVLSGTVQVRAEKTGRATLAAQLGQILIDSASHKPDIQMKGEAWANKAALPVLLASGIVLPFDPAAAIVVLKAGIGNSIRLFAPLGTLCYLNLASRQGILVKDGRVLERLQNIDTVLFDKTGTLTYEQPEVGRIATYYDYSEADILRYAAAAEARLTHPIARAIQQAAQEQHIALPHIDEAHYQIGYGITVQMGHRQVRVGSFRFMQTEGISLNGTQNLMLAAGETGSSLVMVAIDQKLGGVIELRATMRPELRQVIADLRKNGIRHIGIVSGDHQQPTLALANQLGADSYFCNVLPEQKAHIVEQLQREGRTVCFVGDGVNDSIAMNRADVAFSLKGASSIATDAAQIVFMDGRLTNMSNIFELARDLDRNLHSSLKITLASGFAALGCVFLPGATAIVSAYLIKAGAKFAGIANATQPLWRKRG